MRFDRVVTERGGRIRFEVDAKEWSAMIRRIAQLEGAIAAHEILTQQNRRACDELLYAICEEGNDE
jgi:hypothetical protein